MRYSCHSFRNFVYKSDLIARMLDSGPIRRPVSSKAPFQHSSICRMSKILWDASGFPLSILWSIRHMLQWLTQRRSEVHTHFVFVSSNRFSVRFFICPVSSPRGPYSHLRAAILSNLPQELRTIIENEADMGLGILFIFDFESKSDRLQLIHCSLGDQLTMPPVIQALASRSHG